jgi:hypothetical protein
LNATAGELQNNGASGILPPIGGQFRTADRDVEDLGRLAAGGAIRSDQASS